MTSPHPPEASEHPRHLASAVVPEATTLDRLRAEIEQLRECLSDLVECAELNHDDLESDTCLKLQRVSAPSVSERMTFVTAWGYSRSRR